MQEKLDLFGVLTFLDEQNMKVYEELKVDSEMLKELERNVSYILPIWMSGASNDKDLYDSTKSFNEICNEGWFSFYKHPELQIKLLAASGLNKKVKHKFFKSKGKESSAPKIRELIEHKYLDIRDDEIKIWCQLNNKSEIKKIAKEKGYQEKELKDVLKEYDKLRNKK
jgi:hypothetical protein